MSISATLQISDGGAFAAFQENIVNIYTVLNLNYTVERSCDKTGRPSGGSNISAITVTIRAAKQSGTPFHDWINSDDKLMNGVIKIYDSAGIISSNLQDTTGSDTPLIEESEILDLPDDMMGGAMDEAMDQASDYGTHDDIYDEMDHKDLVKLAESEGLTVNSSDTDDVIREKIRIKKETDARYDKMKKASDGLITKGKMKTQEDLDEFKKEYKEISWPDASDTSKMTKTELDQYIKDHGLNPPDEGKTETDTLEIYQKYVALHKDIVNIQDMVDKEKKRKEDIQKPIEENHRDKELKNKSLAPAYKKADELKKRTVTTSKQVTKEVNRRVAECARTIKFENAYCISLKEHFDNNPDSKGTLDSHYPWTLEIGIKPKKVTVGGWEVAGIAFANGETEFTLF